MKSGEKLEDLWLVKYICASELLSDPDVKTQAQSLNYMEPLIINTIFME